MWVNLQSPFRSSNDWGPRCHLTTNSWKIPSKIFEAEHLPWTQNYMRCNKPLVWKVIKFSVICNVVLLIRTNINQLQENVKSVFEYCYVETFRVVRAYFFFLFYLFFIIIFIFEMAANAHTIWKIQRAPINLLPSFAQ